MTVTIKCQHSGIEFEAESKRTKNHPLVSAMKIAANKDGNYAELAEAMSKVASGGGYATIEEFIARVNLIMKGAREKRHEAKIAAERHVKAAKEARERMLAERAKTNEILKANGFKWIRVAVGTEDDDFPGGYGAGIGEFSHYIWELFSPEGKKTTVQEAMARISNK